MRWLKSLILLIVVVLVGIQFIPIKHNVSKNIPSTDFIHMFKLTDMISDQLKTSCYNCHSNNTYYSWYSNIQPIGFYLQGHINEGKKNLNFSEFGNYSDRRQKNKLTLMINQINEDKMPLPVYTLIHRDAKLSGEDKRVITEFFEMLKDSL